MNTLAIAADIQALMTGWYQRHRVMKLAIYMSVVLAIGCQSGPPCPAAAPPSRRSAPSSVPTSDAPRQAPTPPLAYVITPVLNESPRLDVQVTTRQPIHRWRAPLADASALTAQDQAGDIRTTIKNGQLTLERPPKPPLTLRYSVRPTGKQPDRFTLDVGKTWFGGAQVLATPLSDAPTETTIELPSKAFGELARSTSSFAQSDRQTMTLTATALQRSMFVVGQIGIGSLVGPEGKDYASWLGYTAFDPRSALAEVAAFRSGARQYFGQLVMRPMTVLTLVSQRSTFDVERIPQSIVVRLGMAQPWSAPLRLAVAHQTLKEWIGGELFMAAEPPERAVWFNEGFARHLAWRLLAEFGLITASEAARAIENLIGVALTGDGAGLAAAQLPARAPKTAAAELTARGALYAALLDADLKRSKTSTDNAKQRGVSEVLRQLFRHVRKNPGPISAELFASTVRTALGTADSRWETVVNQGSVPSLAPTLDACLQSRTTSYAVFGLGYTTDSQNKITNVRKGGPAERAGVKPGDVVTKSVYEPGNADRRVVLTTTRAGTQRVFQYKPVTSTVRGPGATLRKGVDETKCFGRR